MSIHANTPQLPALVEHSMSSPTEVEKRRRGLPIWPFLRAWFGFKSKGRAGGLSSVREARSSNVPNANEPTNELVVQLLSSPDVLEPGPKTGESQSAMGNLEPAVEPGLHTTISPPTPREAVGDINPIITEQRNSSEVPQLVVNDGNHSPISRQMPAHKVVSRLVEHGCEDLSELVDASTFAEHPVAIGGLSDIYRGHLIDGRLVAVKALRIAAQQSIARELHTWGKCKHPNVLPLYGLATFRDRIGMVSPWMSKGTLPQYLAANPGADRRGLCIQICEGLAHMHKNEIIHGDLKGANVLIDDQNNAVLADFGSSTLKDQSLKFTQAASGRTFTVRWSAPELVIASDCKHTKASDVFALGMTIYEVLTGKVPYHEIKDVAPVILRIAQRGTPTRPVTIPDNHESGEMLWTLFTLCWEYAPEGRPVATKVSEMMKAIPLEGVIYQIPQTLNSVHEPRLNGEV
ncbi:unnamed protein product [Rhizoctonia solani]|uniref:Protein kinase domain-containing protein n=1 Tax=Rhizoctonia solani TaxID=456999 RepID=A0A8H3GI27_9AGAM|nr:unnamed protein product [Rhizoctonia solani]